MGFERRQTRSIALPFPSTPGTSPFHTKGLLYRGNIEFHDRYVPGGFAATLAHLDNDALRTFFKQTFLATSFYDVAPVLALSATGALLSGQPTWQFVRETARFNAHLRLQEIFKSLLFHSPEAMFVKVPRIIAQNVDFGETEATMVGDGHGRVFNHKVPAFLSVWFFDACQGYFTGALELAGAKDIRIPRTTPTEPDGTVRGVEAIRAKYDVQWA